MVFRSWRSLAAMAVLVMMGNMRSTWASPQFHLSLAGDGSSDYFLDWITPTPTPTSCDETTHKTPSSELYYGADASSLAQVAVGTSNGQVEEAPGQLVHCWTARLTNLTANEPVYYALSPSRSRNQSTDATHTKDVQSFVPRSADKDLTWAVWADLGAAMQGDSSGLSLPALTQTALKDHAYEAIFNLGDLSYELTGLNAQNYMDSLAPITASVPMQVTTGNHEYRYALSNSTMSNYYRRFGGQYAGMGSSSGSNSNEFFSFNSGRVHFVMLNTELYGKDIYVKQDPKTGEWIEFDDDEREKDSKLMAKWMKNDLKDVNRDETPYVVVAAHRCPFKAPKRLGKKSNRYGDEIVPLLDKYNVDLLLCAHTHLYMVLDALEWEGYKIPPTIVSGAPGNADGLDSLEDVKLGDFQVNFHVDAYGFGLLQATDDALEWRWGSTGSRNDTTPTDWTEVHQYSVPRNIKY